MQSASFDAPCWPSPSQHALLRACLGTDAEEVQVAWQSWKSSQEFDRIDSGSTRMIPLLLHQLERFGIQDPNAGRYRGLQRYAWVRSQMLQHSLVEVSDVLAAKGIPLLLLKGAALGPLYYPGPFLRPVGDVDGLVPRAQAKDAIECLAAAGWLPIRGSVAQVLRFSLSSSHAYCLLNHSWHIFDLHWKLSKRGVTPGSDQRFWNSFQAVVVQGQSFRTLSSTHHLFQAIVHGVAWVATPSFRWVADACLILRNSASQIDWQEFTGCVRDLQVGVIVSHGLAYLKREFQAPIPDDVLQNVSALARESWEWREFRRITHPLPFWLPTRIWHSYRRYHALRSATGRDSLIAGFSQYVCAVWQLDRRREIPGAAIRKLVNRLERKIRVPPKPGEHEG